MIRRLEAVEALAVEKLIEARRSQSAVLLNEVPDVLGDVIGLI